jgi:hypothetical protein
MKSVAQGGAGLCRTFRRSLPMPMLRPVSTHRGSHVATAQPPVSVFDFSDNAILSNLLPGTQLAQLTVLGVGNNFRTDGRTLHLSMVLHPMHCTIIRRTSAAPAADAKNPNRLASTMPQTSMRLAALWYSPPKIWRTHAQEGGYIGCSASV